MSNETPKTEPSMFSMFKSIFSRKKEPDKTAPPNTIQPNTGPNNASEITVGGRGRRRKSLRRRRRRHIKSTHRRRKY